MTEPRPTAQLVESIPTGVEDLRVIHEVAYTEDVLVELVDGASETIDLTAMYWALLADPSSSDESGFTDEQLAAFGAGRGRELYDALERAAKERKVQIRIIQAPGFGTDDEPVEQESDGLAAEYPDQIAIHTITMGDWYGGGGIMHQKLWVFDHAHVYIGSANMDWKSITQVKEMGVVVRDCPVVAADVSAYFEQWWQFSDLPPRSVEALDDRVQIDRDVPYWSSLVGDVASPLDQDVTTHGRETPLVQELNGESGSLFVTGAPNEVCGPARTWDGDGLVWTIDDAERSVCVSVMDLAPVSLYSRKAKNAPPDDPRNTPVWWPDLFDALLTAALTRRVRVRLLVSTWAHTSTMIEPFLRALQQAADAGRANNSMVAGQLEIKRFVIPGWDSTTGSWRDYPGHTRVNHTKYIVTDRRCNIGTSNMTWDYFSATAGASFNADHPSLVRTLQAVFDRDWASSYASHLT